MASVSSLCTSLHTPPDGSDLRRLAADSSRPGDDRSDVAYLQKRIERLARRGVISRIEGQGSLPCTGFRARGPHRPSVLAHDPGVVVHPFRKFACEVVENLRDLACRQVDDIGAFRCLLG
jgi:hypothetical protein